MMYVRGCQGEVLLSTLSLLISGAVNAAATQQESPPEGAEDEAALSEERHYYGQFCYPLVIVSPLQDGDTDAWLRILAALAYLDAGFLMFFCERPSCFPETYFRDVFPASRHLLLPERGSPAVIRAFLTLLPDLRHRRRPAGRNAGRER